MAQAKLTDQCLWLKHIERGPLRDALESMHPSSVISLKIDGEPIDFQRMATGRDGRVTNGFNPVGPNASVWRQRYTERDHQLIEIEFAGHLNA